MRLIFLITWVDKRLPATGELLFQRPHLAGFKLARKEDVFAAAELSFPLPGGAAVAAALELLEHVVGLAMLPSTGLALIVEVWQLVGVQADKASIDEPKIGLMWLSRTPLPSPRMPEQEKESLEVSSVRTFLLVALVRFGVLFRFNTSLSLLKQNKILKYTYKTTLTQGLNE